MHRLASIAVAFGLGLLLPGAALAQQSSVCVTPAVKCRAATPGPKGGACACYTQRGWVTGRLG